ncbi:F-box protein At5g07610-like [Argentina anserina]|uniref:F-box protein At5g07610-like n=1 Tax=Argentina anserina TaxID=57926 RepID=UPI0021761D78|nr:F-box protein At5g07610-like [Potentilla anserina]XP_050373073.1 F-box protein At5g07610-like [Potentilla anserina]
MSVSSSATDIASNEDLLSQILVRLPPKSLICFKCVSKQWLSLISNPQFIATHIRCRGIASPSGLLLNNDYLHTPEFHYVPLSHSNPSELTPPPYLSYLGAPRIKILQSCNGLLLCSSAYQKNDPNYELKYFDDLSQTEDDVLLPDIWHVIPTISNACSQTRIHYSGFRFYVCNPTTKQFKTLSFPFFQYHILALNIAFDPLHSPYFKILCILKKDLDSHVIHLYDSETKTWNSSPISFNAPRNIHFREPVFCRRAIHWYSSQQTSLYFDVDKECLNPMPMPQSSLYGTVNYFGESGGHLHLILSTTSFLEFDVFELEKDYSAWSVKYRLNIEGIRVSLSGTCGFSSIGSNASVLRITCGEKEEESEAVVFIFGIEGSMVASCNLSNGTHRRPTVLVPSREAVLDFKILHSHTDSFPFIETLSPL